MAGGFTIPVPGGLLGGGHPGSPPVAAIPASGANGSLFTITLDEYVFVHRPVMDKIRNIKNIDSTETFSGGQVRSFGFPTQADGLIGTIWRLTWPIMLVAAYENLLAYYDSTEQVIWNPEERARQTDEQYIVKIPMVDHRHHHRIADYIVGVTMDMNIRDIAP